MVEYNTIRYKITIPQKSGIKCYIITEGVIKMIKILLSRKLGEIRWTQADLSRVTGIRPNTIGELYHEMTTRVNLEQINLICEALNCPLDELLVYVPYEEPKIIHNKRGSLKKKINY